MRKQPHFLRRFAVTAAVALALCAGVSAQAASLVPLGRAVGIQMTTAGMLVADLAEVDTPGGKATPAKDAGLLPGDVICRIDGRNIASSADFLAAMDAAGNTILERGGTRGETVRCDIQTLTAMFYGYKRPTYLKRVERLQANDTAVRILEDIIPIEQPYFSDYF